jgi:hypothetical protein
MTREEKQGSNRERFEVLFDRGDWALAVLPEAAQGGRAKRCFLRRNAYALERQTPQNVP